MSRLSELDKYLNKCSITSLDYPEIKDALNILAPLEVSTLFLIAAETRLIIEIGEGLVELSALYALAGTQYLCRYCPSSSKSFLEKSYEKIAIEHRVTTFVSEKDFSGVQKSVLDKQIDCIVFYLPTEKSLQEGIDYWKASMHDEGLFVLIRYSGKLPASITEDYNIRKIGVVTLLEKK